MFPNTKDRMVVHIQHLPASTVLHQDQRTPLSVFLLWPSALKLQTHFQFVCWNFESLNCVIWRKEKRAAWWEHGGRASVFLSGRMTSLSTSATLPSPWHVNREGLGYQTHWGSQNELMQLISDVFSTCLPLAGRNWKSCLARKRECNLDYADWMIWPHERLPLLLPRPLFSFLHPSLPSFLALIFVAPQKNVAKRNVGGKT